ncbi:LysR family transcriptional regulator [Chloroflexus sp.]|uniref:LysR family transcriptional regulator n=1 Tax=Chloroflexus sp. TaxID=1904827 RepID=UPI0026297B02|nr:LysR family transcriptional regulator [uncultured Chloroflexus sp.]
MLNTVYLQTFLAVVETGSFSAAARRLHMSQPAVSQQIRALEEQVGGVRLFRRSGQQMVLTLAGEQLLSSARELVAMAERAVQTVSALRGQIGGRVTVGCLAGGAEAFLPHLLAIAQRHYPAVVVDIDIATTERLLEGLSERRFDLVLLSDAPRRRGLELRLLGGERLALTAAAGHPLLQQDQVPAGILRDYPLALPRIGHPLRRVIEDGLRRRGLNINDMRVIFEADSPSLLRSAVEAGLALAFLPVSVLPLRLDQIGIVTLAGQPLAQEWHLIRLRERSPSRVVDLLTEALSSDEARLTLLKLGLTT